MSSDLSAEQKVSKHTHMHKGTNGVMAGTPGGLRTHPLKVGGLITWGTGLHQSICQVSPTGKVTISVQGS